MADASRTPFERNITPSRIDAGRYALDYDEAFMGVGALFGGVTLASAIRAASEELGDPELRIRSASCMYLSPITAAPTVAEVCVLRRGRSVAQTRISLTCDGTHALEVIAIFSRDRPGFEFTDQVMPEAPPPEACRSFLDPPSPFEQMSPPFWAKTPIWESVERRQAIGHPWWERDWEPSGSFGAMWLKLREPPRPEHGGARTLAAVALTDVAGQAISEQVGPGVKAWGMTSADHAVHVFDAPTSDWVLLSYRANRAAEGFVSVTTQAWDERGTLLAVASQVVFVFFPKKRI